MINTYNYNLFFTTKILSTNNNIIYKSNNSIELPNSYIANSINLVSLYKNKANLKSEEHAMQDIFEDTKVGVVVGIGRFTLRFAQRRNPNGLRIRRRSSLIIFTFYI